MKVTIPVDGSRIRFNNRELIKVDIGMWNFHYESYLYSTKLRTPIKFNERDYSTNQDPASILDWKISRKVCGITWNYIR